MKNLIPLGALVVTLAACGSAGQPASHVRASAAPIGAASSPAATGAPQPTGPLFAVLEGSRLDTGESANTVAIVGLDGRAIAKATFLPRQAPNYGNAAVILQSEAQVGDAGVYYADGNGVVRLLKPSGTSTVVATFAMTPVQHEMWYAISPDGTQLLAGVLTYPALGPPAPGMPWPSLVGDWAFDLESATAGGPSHVLQHIDSGDPSKLDDTMWKPVFPVGWTQAGPVAMVGAHLATQNEWTGGPLFSIDEAGRPAERIGGSDCTAARILPSGLVPCISTATGGRQFVSVRDSTGRVLWTPAVDSFNARGLRLTPDGSAIAMDVHAATRTQRFTLPDGFHAEGWLDGQTVVGRQSGGDLSYIRLESPTVVHDLGFTGDFVGMLTAH